MRLSTTVSTALAAPRSSHRRRGVTSSEEAAILLRLGVGRRAPPLLQLQVGAKKQHLVEFFRIRIQQ